MVLNKIKASQGEVWGTIKGLISPLNFFYFVTRNQVQIGYNSKHYFNELSDLKLLGVFLHGKIICTFKFEKI